MDRLSRWSTLGSRLTWKCCDWHKCHTSGLSLAARSSYWPLLFPPQFIKVTARAIDTPWLKVTVCVCVCVCVRVCACMCVSLYVVDYSPGLLVESNDTNIKLSLASRLFYIGINPNHYSETYWRSIINRFKVIPKGRLLVGPLSSRSVFSYIYRYMTFMPCYSTKSCPTWETAESTHYYNIVRNFVLKLNATWYIHFWGQEITHD